MSKDQKGFIVYGDTKPLADELTDEQLGQLFRGMLNYFVEGKAPKFTGVLKFAFIPLKQQMDRDAEKYDKKCEKMRANANKRWQADAKAPNGMQTYANDANTNTNTNTKTDTDTKTTTTTNTNTDAALKQQGGRRLDSDDSFNIWKQLTPEKVDQIYDVYPESAGFLIDEVYEEVRVKKKTVKDPVAYILGYARNKNWDDSANHFEEVN